jgi:hypothetical protein
LLEKQAAARRPDFCELIYYMQGRVNGSLFRSRLRMIAKLSLTRPPGQRSDFSVDWRGPHKYNKSKVRFNDHHKLTCTLTSKGRHIVRHAFVLATLIALTTSANLHAAVVRVFPKLGGVYNSDYSPVDPSLIVSNDPYHPILAPRAEKYVVAVDVLMTIGEFAGPQIGFASVKFDVDLPSSIVPSTETPGWIEATLGGPFPDTAKFAMNQDLGESQADLKEILLENYAKDFPDFGVGPRLTHGIAPYQNEPVSAHLDGEYAGSFFVELDGMNPNGVIRVLTNSPVAFDAEFKLTTDNVSALGAVLPIGVPEPSSLVLLGLGSAAFALAIRRR